MEAEGYCLDCSEHLCSSCFNCHKHMSVSMHHKLLGKDRMPTSSGCVKAKDVCTERCGNHEDEIVKYFCLSHKELECSVCVTIEHRLCKDVAYIPEFCKDLENSEDYKAFQASLGILMFKAENMRKTATENATILKDSCSKVLSDVEKFKQEILHQVNELEDEIKSRMEKLKQSDAERLDNVYDTGTRTLEELQSISTAMENQRSKKQYCQMFTYMKNSHRKLLELGERLKNIKDINLKGFTFQSGEALQTIVRKKHALGRIVETFPENTGLAHVTDVNVRSHKDNYPCIISGATVLSEKKLVVTDFANGTVKLCDAENNKVVSRLNDVQCPWDVTTVSQVRVAVTLPSAQKIIFLSCDGKLVIEKEIKVNGSCWGIDCTQDRLFITYNNPAKVEMMGMKGEVLQSFATNNQGDQLFSSPEYVCVSPNNQSIYVSDRDTNSVTQLDMEGDVMAVYTNDELSAPGKMFVDRAGTVYLCGGNSHSIHLLTPQCKKVKILLKEKDGLRYPRSICYLEAAARLYIGLYRHDSVKVYQVKTLTASTC